MASIRHFPATHPLPDWRNFGVILRVLLGVNLLVALAVLLEARDLASWSLGFVAAASFVEPLLLLALGALAGIRDLLWRLPLRQGQALVLLLVAGLAVVLLAYRRGLGMVEAGTGGAALLLALGVTALVLHYFSLRARALTPAQGEARLAALNARIRPHFLFNSLNAVLSLIRSRPREAEAALESLADLVRAAMRDPSEQICLADEIELARQYLALEKLRLGERLQVTWQIAAVPLQMSIPPLMLQPLLENAVRHGIEPLPDGGVVGITIERRGAELHIEISNPTAGRAEVTTGHQIALSNIRERLALYYDLEARLESQEDAQHYRTHIVLPCRQISP